MNRRTFISKGWKWTGLLLVPTVARALPPLMVAALNRPTSGELLAGQSTIPLTGLLARYPFTNASQCLDTSGNGHDGTAFNNFGNTPVSNHNGTANAALYVDPTGGQYATLPNLWTTDWSMCVWLNPQNDAVAQFQRIIGQTAFTTDLAMNDGGGSGFNTLKSFDGAVWQTISAVPFTIGTWIHLGLTFDHVTPSLNVYSNGTLANTNTGATAYPRFATLNYLGADKDGASPGKFYVSELLEYSRVLTSPEVNQIFTNT